MVPCFGEHSHFESRLDHVRLAAHPDCWQSLEIIWTKQKSGIARAAVSKYSVDILSLKAYFRVQFGERKGEA